MKHIKAMLSLFVVLAAMIGALHAQSGASSPSQRRVTPPGGSWAGGADLGFVNPLGDDDFDAEPTLQGYLEYFCTPHVSVRGMLGFVSFDGPDVPGLGSVDLELRVFNANVLYQWEGGTVHPFVTGGIGLYDYDPDFGESDLEPGINLGGGMNLYTTDRFAIKLEALLHATDGREPDSYLSGTAGVRWLWGGR